VSIDTFPSRDQAAPHAVLAFGSGGALPQNLNNATFQNLGPTIQAFVLPGRWIRLSLKCRMAPANNTDIYKIILLQDGVIVADLSHSFAVGGWGQTFPVVDAYIRPLPGLHTYTAQIQRETGAGTTGSVQNVDYYTVEDASGGAAGQGPVSLGHKELTTAMLGLSGPQNINNLELTVNIPAGRKIRISAYAQMSTADNYKNVGLRIMEGATVLQEADQCTELGGNLVNCAPVWVGEVSGIHTYKVMGVPPNAGLYSVNATVNQPAYLLVEDITGTEAPSGAYYEAVWTPVTSFLNSWVNYGGWGTAAYRKVNDLVYLRGLVRNGVVGTSIFTLPAGYRPPASLVFPNVTGEPFTPGRIDVLLDGNVWHASGVNGYVSLSGIVFGTT
jgi:hypothetical protein